MEMRLALAVLVLAVAAASQLPSAAEATNYTVGDEKGWNPKVDYTAWVKKHRPFFKGDQLIFEYQNRRSDVVQVDEVGYDNCGEPRSAKVGYQNGRRRSGGTGEPRSAKTSAFRSGLSLTPSSPWSAAARRRIRSASAITGARSQQST